ILRRRDIPVPEIVNLIARLWINQPDADQLFGMRKRKSAQHNRVDHGELGHGAADPKRQHEDGEDAKNLVLQKNTKSDTDILIKRFKHHDDFTLGWVEERAKSSLC